MEERARGNIVARARVGEPYYFVAFARRMITMIDKENMSFSPVKGTACNAALQRALIPNTFEDSLLIAMFISHTFRYKCFHNYQLLLHAKRRRRFSVYEFLRIDVKAINSQCKFR